MQLRMFEKNITATESVSAKQTNIVGIFLVK